MCAAAIVVVIIIIINQFRDFNSPLYINFCYNVVTSLHFAEEHDVFL